MADERKNTQGSGGPLDYILDDHKRKEESYREDSCVTGSDSMDLDDRQYKIERTKRIVSIVTSFSLVLGFLIFLFLWLNR